MDLKSRMVVSGTDRYWRGRKKKQRWADIDRLINCKEQQGSSKQK